MSSMVCLGVLPKARARIDADAGAVDAGRLQSGGRIAQVIAHFGHHVLVNGVVLHGSGLALHVHDHAAAAAAAHRSRMAGSRKPDTSLTMEAPACRARTATSAWRVSTDTQMPASTRAATTSPMRSHSSSGVTGVAPDASTRRPHPQWRHRRAPFPDRGPQLPSDRDKRRRRRRNRGHVQNAHDDGRAGVEVVLSAMPNHEC